MQSRHDFEIIVVDNASDDWDEESLTRFRRESDEQGVLMFRNSKNLGFPVAVNSGIAHAVGDHLILLNPDTLLVKGWFQELMSYVEASPSSSIIQSKVLYLDNLRINSAGNLFDRFGFVRCRGDGERDLGQYDNDEKGFFHASGACMLIRRDVVRRIGMFDNQLFAYHEDVDFCWRARLAGDTISLASRSVCLHLGSPLLKKISPRKYFLLCRNRIRVMLKNYSSRNIVLRLPVAITLVVLCSIYLSVGYRDVYYIYFGLTGLASNLKLLTNTIRSRQVVQKSRKLADHELESVMHGHSLEIMELKRRIILGKGYYLNPEEVAERTEQAVR